MILYRFLVFAAVSIGAKVIEKHFILDKSTKSPDADFSLCKEEFAQMVKAVRDTERLLGKVSYEVKKTSRQFTRSLYVSKDIKRGEIFSKENIRSIRPGFGMHPKYFKNILGKKAQKNYSRGERL